MQEFWVCQGCHSLNRAGAGRCYHCKLKYGQKPKEQPAVIKNAASAYGAGGGTGGLTSTYGSSVAAGGYGGSGSTPYEIAASADPLPSSAGRLHLPHPTDPIRRRITRALTARPYVGVERLGYFAAALLGLVFLVAVALVAAIAPRAIQALNAASLDALASSLAKPGALLLGMEIAFAVLATLSLAAFSLFLGLTTHNALGLGADLPYLTPYRAGVCWLNAIWAQAKLAIALILPAVLFARGYGIVGGILALVFLEIAQRRLDHPMAWLSRPHRHVADLVTKLGIDGAGRPALALLWQICFVAANLLAIVVWLIPLGVLLVGGAEMLSRQTEAFRMPSVGWAPTKILIGGSIAGLAVSAIAVIGLLVPITFWLSRAQRTRRALVIAGRTRQWTPRTVPGYADADRLREEDELVDRDTFEQESRFEQRARFGYASLNSPSTTSSSPPWAPGSSPEPPV